MMAWKVYVNSSSQILRHALTTIIKQALGLDFISVYGDSIVPPKKSTQIFKLLLLLDCLGKTADEIWAMFDKIKLVSKGGNPHVALFNVSTRSSNVTEGEAYRRGAVGIFSEDNSLDLMLKGIQTIVEGELWFSRKEMSHVLKTGKNRIVGSVAAPNNLTNREKEILNLIADGFSNAEIAIKLHISPHTVKTHNYHLFRKIEVPNRLQAALWVANSGFSSQSHYLNQPGSARPLLGKDGVGQ